MIIPKDIRKEMTSSEKWEIRRMWLDWRISPIRCFIVGHDIKWTGGGYVEPIHTYCDTCHRDEEDYMYTHTIPAQLHRAHTWLMEHSSLFVRVDTWLWNNVKHLPDWMEY